MLNFFPYLQCIFIVRYLSHKQWILTYNTRKIIKTHINVNVNQQGKLHDSLPLPDSAGASPGAINVLSPSNGHTQDIFV